MRTHVCLVSVPQRRELRKGLVMSTVWLPHDIVIPTVVVFADEAIAPS